MAKFHSFIALFLVSILPFIHSLSTVAISETGNKTLICAVIQSSTVVNCTSSAHKIHFLLDSGLTSVSGVVAGDGFVCVLSSFYSSSKSVMVCWRFSSGDDSNVSYKRVYNGSILSDLSSGNSRICGLVNGSRSIQCWQWRNFNYSGEIFASSIAVGEDFVCGLTESRRVVCFGDDRNVVDKMPEGKFSYVAAGFGHACGVALNGKVECWGNVMGEVPGEEFTSVALGENRSCAVRPNGTAVCWGENGFSLPELLRSRSFVSIVAKRRVFCGVEMENYTLFCWGNEAFESNPSVFSGVVPGVCRNGNECVCGPLPDYGEYCGEGLKICRPCVEQPGRLTPPPSSPPHPQPQSESQLPSSAGKSGWKWSSKLVVFMVVGCVGSFSSLLVLCIYLYSRCCNVSGSRIHDSGRLEEGASPGEPDNPRPTIEKKLSHLISMGNGTHLEEFSLEVLLKATDNFSDELKIGTGSFGSVYHAALDDGRQVAVKRAETSTPPSGATRRSQDEKDNAFVNELEFLSRLNHKNLVRLLGYCEDHNELLLIYEYMDNGSLFDHLHKLESSSFMSWPRRIKIALDAARGIEYLHEYAIPHIIHRDIKSSNILLDATWTAKVSDFGLSLMCPLDDESHLSLHAAGTMGYMDPEYYRLQLLTTKSDVYSFGIVLLELLSGFKAIHNNENGEPRNVVDYAVPYIIQDEIHRVLDWRVPAPTPFEIEAVAYVGYLAADCVIPEGKDRPTMSEVVNSLDRALEACLAPQVLSRSTSSSST